VSAGAPAAPRRLELTWTDARYRVSIPNYLSDGERVKLREDRAVAADIEAVAMRLADIAHPGDMLARRAWCEAKARLILAAVFSEVADA
jgi:hypothetical protein